jgi:hypothetical protein
MNEQNTPTQKAASHAYLVEAALDREWEKNYRKGNFHRMAHLPEGHSPHIQMKETGTSTEEEGRT